MKKVIIRTDDPDDTIDRLLDAALTGTQTGPDEVTLTDLYGSSPEDTVWELRQYYFDAVIVDV